MSAINALSDPDCWSVNFRSTLDALGLISGLELGWSSRHLHIFKTFMRRMESAALYNSAYLTMSWLLPRPAWADQKSMSKSLRPEFDKIIYKESSNWVVSCVAISRFVCHVPVLGVPTGNLLPYEIFLWWSCCQGHCWCSSAHSHYWQSLHCRCDFTYLLAQPLLWYTEQLSLTGMTPLSLQVLMLNILPLLHKIRVAYRGQRESKASLDCWRQVVPWSRKICSALYPLLREGRVGSPLSILGRYRRLTCVAAEAGHLSRHV